MTLPTSPTSPGSPTSPAWPDGLVPYRRTPEFTETMTLRRSDWFSPIVAMLLVSFSATVPPPG